MRPNPTKQETSHKIAFVNHKHIHDVQILSFRMIYDILVTVLFDVQNPLSS